MKILVVLSGLLVWGELFGQSSIRLANKEELLAYIAQDNGKAKVINFWATWCRPCVAELPYFQAMLKKYSPEKVEFLLVSLDFKKELTTRVLPFVERRGLVPYVWLLDEPNPDDWIDSVEPTWQGDIPATLFLNPTKNKRIFLAKEFSTQEDLEKQIQQLLD